MILLDNSEFMRNGDYVPTRLGAQHDAANLLATQKTRSNPESTVGVLAMSGGKFMHSGGDVDMSSSSTSSNMELLVTPTEDMGKILSALHGIPIRGGAAAGREAMSTPSGVDISASIHVASLALKHRRNKNGQQRIVLFVGSPLTHVDSKTLVKTGKTLKKNNVALDVVAMGELEENETKLRELVDAANGGAGVDGGENTCHLVTIPPGVLPSDVLVNSPIFHGGAADATSSAVDAGAGAFAEFGGIDPNMDPELAMALRISMEEERARQERLARDQQQPPATGTDTHPTSDLVPSIESTDIPMDTTAGSTTAPPATGISFHPHSHDDDMGDEDALLQQALAMSMAESQTQSSISTTQPMQVDSQPPTATVEYEDAEMQMALQMSMQDSESRPPIIQDPSFVQQLLESIPGATATLNTLTPQRQASEKPGVQKNTDDENQDTDNAEDSKKSK
jgi:26S proteasome regulatory subunit N10